MGATLDYYQFPAELTFSVNGAYWGAFGPGFTEGRADTDLLITRTVDPVAVPAAALQRLVGGRPPGADAAIGIR